ncbi:uncharacterized protein LOC102300725 isoform X3 [Haplochromis burtoni]|uniref:uncharacterized protein LOC102300725 isoform X3 n=1 Tax=Haplochromis burtoni TaxID=8153 RepID=UPI001C2DBF56|nr:uncharacterized protein LOC102300725 isoform X3 [Haplochromis burtoni]
MFTEGSSSSSFRDFEVTVTDVIPSLTGQNQYGLYVGLTLTVTIILVSVSVLIFYKKRSSKRKDVPVETQYADVTEATDNSNKLTHSALSFLNKARVSPSNASCSNTDEVVSSVSRKVHFKDFSPVSTCKASNYQNLNGATRDQDQIYSTLKITDQTLQTQS